MTGVDLFVVGLFTGWLLLFVADWLDGWRR